MLEKEKQMLINEYIENVKRFNDLGGEIEDLESDIEDLKLTLKENGIDYENIKIYEND